MDVSVWEPLVRAALEEGIKISAGPVPGARLRQIIARHAGASGLQFPPDVGTTFGSFLEQFPESLFVQRRPGRDMVCVPADRVALLSTPSEALQNAVLRRDLFEALTLIPGMHGGPLYIRSSDSVLWPDAGTEAPVDAIALPHATQEVAIQDRRDFSAQAPTKEVRAVLEESLQHARPLRSFSEAIRAHGLARDWHQFRVGRLLERLKAWSKDKDVPWRTDWFLGADQVAEQSLGTAPGPTGASSAQEFLSALAAVLKEGDMARISIPLDLVARAWGQRG